MRPAAQREAARYAQQTHGISQRRAIRLVGCNRKTARLVPQSCPEDKEVCEKMQSFLGEQPAAGYRMLWALLRQDGLLLNHKKVYRLYKANDWALPAKTRKRLKSEGRGLPQPATSPNEEWSLDFLHDALCDGRAFRILNIVDSFTRQALVIECDTSLPGERVVRVLEAHRLARGAPRQLRIDNGPEFRSQALDVWAKTHGVTLFFIEPGKPMQNGTVESFNGTLRRECLDQEWFVSLAQARQTIEAWRVAYNTRRPHSSLGYLPPDLWAQQYQSLYF